jgi:hypothetical protein
LSRRNATKKTKTKKQARVVGVYLVLQLKNTSSEIPMLSIGEEEKKTKKRRGYAAQKSKENYVQ